MRRPALATFLASLVSLAGCGAGASSSSDVQPTATRAASSAAPVRATDHARRHGPAVAAVVAAHVTRTAYGQALVDRRGFALYRFTSDRSAASTCYGACAAAWPPYILATRMIAAGAGAHDGLLGSVRRHDGRLQLTYAGHPLYYYVGDRSPGEVLCQAVAEYGGRWYVVDAQGATIR